MGKNKKGLDIDGWVIIDKPEGIGSTPIVSKVRRGLNANKAGHAGTLDPFASGILPIALGLGTKTIQFIQDAEKEYTFTVQFGKTTDTLDTEGIETDKTESIPTEAMILETLPKFIGKIKQIPPAYSAIKIDGKRAYDLARAGEEVEIPEREVDIKELEFLGWESKDSANFRVLCGKGTYVRTLGADMAKAMGSLGYLTALRRTRVGMYDLKSAITLANFEKIIHKDFEIDDVVLSIESSLAGIPVLTVADRKAGKFQSGQTFGGSHLGDYADYDIIVVATTTHIYGFGRVVDGVVKSVRVFNNPVPKKG
ncbi:MAG: tRNA pseudouridine(55) synthase TruB [Alphaproteobacteria bacterium]